MTAPGERDLARLLAALDARLVGPVLVYVTVPAGRTMPAGLGPVMRMEEAEGTTLVLPRDEALAAGLAGVFPCRMITLTVPSSLEAVGFMAAVAGRLAAAGIGVNPVAGFHHDHLFVAEADAAAALQVLHALAASHTLASSQIPASSHAGPPA
ncbi:ACT domain-containing protein [Pseudoxanthobacter sp.]|uniref:ACT domain-containing protein n=1 Tax=Pseudoxanthobacter sp. TaxID=1925742 RepID=UPI002FE40B0A